MIHFIAGEIVFLGLITAACSMGGQIMDFVDLPSIIFILGGGLGSILVSYSLKDIGDAVKRTFGADCTVEQLHQSAYFWLCATRNLLIVGAIGTIIGQIQMLGNLEDANTIGPSLAVSLITFFYGIILSGVLPLPAYFMILRRIESKSVMDSSQ